MSPRERWNRIMQYQPVDRLPVMALEPYEEPGIKRWHEEGLPQEGSPQELLGMDILRWVPVSFDPRPAFATDIISESEEDYIERDYMGATVRRLKRAPSMYYGYIDHPVKSLEDWDAYKARFDAATQDRYPVDPQAAAAELNAYESPVCLMFFPFFFRLGFYLMGMERFMTAFYEDPKLIHSMFSFFGEFVLGTIKPVLSKYRIDFASFAEDLAYKGGPHISPATYREFWLPYQQPIISELQKHNVPIIAMYSAGNLRPLLPLLMENGFNCTYPLERASGMNPLELRSEFGRDLRLAGGVSKESLISGPEAIDREIDSLMPVIEEGGFVPTLDDMVPPEVPLSHYRYYLEKTRGIKLL